MTARPSRPVAHRARTTLLAFACTLMALSGVAMAYPVAFGTQEWAWLGWPLGAVGFGAGLEYAHRVRKGKVS